jgi:uncharacterized protein (DUF3084 family)
MFHLAILVALLLALAGVIAYLGDRLGTAVGRRRLSLFGWRPRRTGQLIGIAAGIVIMLSTLGILTLAFRGAASVLVNAQHTYQELAGLRLERRGLQGQVGQLSEQIDASSAKLRSFEQQLTETQAKLQAAQKSRDDALSARDQARKDAQQAQQQAVQLRDTANQLKQQLAGLGTQVSNLKISAEHLGEVNRALTQSNAELQDKNTTLQQGNALLSTQNKELQLNLGKLSKQVTTLQTQIDALNGKLAEQAQALTSAQQQVQAFNSGNIVYQKGQIIYQGTISAQDPGDIQTALSAFVQDANNETLRKGAGQIALTPEQVKSLIDAIAASPGADVVALISPANQVPKAQIQVEVEAYENDKLLSAGQLLVSRQVYLGTPAAPITQADMRSALAGLIADATSKLQQLGLFAGESPELVDLSEESFTALLSRMSGSVVIGLVAAEPVYRSGPAKLELTIIR